MAFLDTINNCKTHNIIIEDEVSIVTHDMKQ